ncbi:hypothetical protein [Pseudomonas sp. PDM09]|uniref:hypothetical protein n=1 Tax=Pseudomonas sp. PDM09 TaxID=2769270 RepID=UPI00177B99FA|nr:hypothetical protein [Pseudomonas sp. PDM09]MBD9562116.1 hypothetical protein [Pseudomonas sp. PDM09]
MRRFAERYPPPWVSESRHDNLDRFAKWGGSQQLDVSPLLNLANGKMSMGLPSFPNTNYNSSMVFKNADSFALTTSLLSQLKTNKQAYQQNIATMKAALKNANHGYISGQTLVKINIL